tara:strand:- start:7402 stop:8139 length:738 start_codon:yes stop_codon:yes gene_type:complete
LSFEKFYKSREDIEIIIIDDGSNENHRLNTLVDDFKTLDIKLIELGKKRNNLEVNPCYPYNVGVRHSSGDILILSSPETFHTSDMFEITNNFEKLDDSTYILLSVFCSTDKKLTNDIVSNDFVINHEDKQKMYSSMSSDQFNNQYGSWYLHSIFRNTNLNFLSCITRKNFFGLSGFDERYRFGTGYDDAEFLDRLKLKVKRFIYYNNANAIHADHEIVHNLPPTINHRLYNSKMPYPNNDNWGRN